MGESPVVVVASAGSERDGSATQRTFSGPIAAKFALDVYVFVLTFIKDDDGNSITKTMPTMRLMTLECAIAQAVADYPSAQTWTAIGYGGRTEAAILEILDGSQYKRERIPLVLTGK
jgi:hypothetical protein